MFGRSASLDSRFATNLGETTMHLRLDRNERFRLILRGALCFLGCLAAFNCTSLARAAVTITAGYNQVEAYRGSDGLTDSHNASITAAPQMSAVSAVVGASSSITTYSSLDAGGQANFEWAFTQTRDGSYVSYGDSYGHIYFNVDVDSSYSVSGLSELVGDERLYQYVTLRDTTTAIYFLHSYNESLMTPNDTLRVGQPDGDYGNNLSGSTTGTLLAGHSYDLFYDYFIQTLPRADAGASASGLKPHSHRERFRGGPRACLTFALGRWCSWMRCWRLPAQKSGRGVNTATSCLCRALACSLAVVVPCFCGTDFMSTNSETAWAWMITLSSVAVAAAAVIYAAWITQ